MSPPFGENYPAGNVIFFPWTICLVEMGFPRIRVMRLCGCACALGGGNSALAETVLTPMINGT